MNNKNFNPRMDYSEAPKITQESCTEAVQDFLTADRFIRRRATMPMEQWFDNPLVLANVVSETHQIVDPLKDTAPVILFDVAKQICKENLQIMASLAGFTK